jgi:hypothetical protein
MMTSVTVCAGVLEPCVRNDSASTADNRITVSTPLPQKTLSHDTDL